MLDLIPPDFTNLGGPPGFDSCTRDVFAKGTTFSIPAILQIASGIASVAAHLHSRGILHGDLYAHNTLINQHYEPLFGDFGAATQYDLANVTLANALQQIEVSAYGCLLDDLLQHVDNRMKESHGFEELHVLRNDCMNPIVSERPLFYQVVSRLDGLAI